VVLWIVTDIIDITVYVVVSDTIYEICLEKKIDPYLIHIFLRILFREKDWSISDPYLRDFGLLLAADDNLLNATQWLFRQGTIISDPYLSDPYVISVVRNGCSDNERSWFISDPYLIHIFGISIILNGCPDIDWLYLIYIWCARSRTQLSTTEYMCFLATCDHLHNIKQCLFK
jgi:hypothetical protein